MAEKITEGRAEAAKKPPAPTPMRKFGRVFYPEADFVLCTALKTGSINGVRWSAGDRVEVPKEVLANLHGVLEAWKKPDPAKQPVARRAAQAKGNWRARG